MAAVEFCMNGVLNMHHFISPKYLNQRITRYKSRIIICFFLFLFYGLFSGLVLAPADYQQGNVYRILYIHVPLAIQSLSVYVIMSLCSLIYLIWKIKIANVIATVSAPVGAVFTALTLITGSIWGKPTWGTFWIWDARLTSEFILLFIYFGIILIRHFIPEKRLSAHATAMITLLGFINIPIVHYSVDWWNTLHQGASILKFGAPSIAPAMLYPLLAMSVAFFLYYVLFIVLILPRELS
ncbi:MAG: hypothetical protein A3E53_07615 [Gammaproteobacteria bacterium RIFCSPHIGHO2_12_FULL_39_24]|nr:MAG: hypothetical protein A3E53_07615 [Gammaproteobacteria bacterium RIFCSPHIGHO2_12_FULL_39_24]